MKNVRKVIIPLSALVLALSLASCDAKRNSEVPYGSADSKLNEAYASSNGFSATYKEVYNKFRQNGYSNFLLELKKAVIKDKMDKYSYLNEEYKSEYNEKIIKAIYGVDNVDDYLDLKEDNIEKSKTAYIKTEFSNYGLNLKTSDLNVTIKNGEFDVNFPEELYKQYQYSFVCEKYAYEYIESIYNEKVIENKDGQKEDNSYYISDDDIEDKFNSTYKYEGDSRVVVVKFDTLAQAKKLVEKVGFELTDENKDEFYATLYNLAYPTKTPLEAHTLAESDEIKYTYDDDSEGLNEVSSDLATFVEDELEDGDYLTTPRNIAGTYYMVYRISYSERDDYATYTESLSEEELKALNDRILKKLIETKATESVGETLVTKRLEDAEVGSEVEIEIYDPIFENQFYNSYTDYYDFKNKFDKNFIFKVTVKFNDSNSFDATLSADDFFSKMDNIYGAEYATSILTDKYLYSLSNMQKGIDSDTLDSYSTTVKDQIKTFNKGNTAYSKKMGLENYLVLTYGYDNKEDVINYNQIASGVKSIYNSYYGAFGTSDDETTFDTENQLFKTFQKYATKNYNNYLSLSASHILIQVVDDKYTDPDDYKAHLSSDKLKADFDNTIESLAKAIEEEASYMTSSTKDSLTFLAKTFNNQGYRYIFQSENYRGKTWEDILKETSGDQFKFKLVAEDLGEITSSGITSYVEEFQDRIKLLYNYIISEDSIYDNIDDESFLEHVTEVTKEGFSELNTLCKTTYGYHIINVYEASKKQSAKFTKANDTKSSSSDYSTYEHNKVVVDERESDTTADDLYYYASAYSDYEEASTNQLFIYFFQKSSITGMSSSLATKVGNQFSTIYSTYTSSDFIAYRLITQLSGKGTKDDTYGISYSGITFASDNIKNRFNRFMELKRLNILSDYDELSESDTFYGWFDEDWTIDTSTYTYPED